MGAAICMSMGHVTRVEFGVHDLYRIDKLMVQMKCAFIVGHHNHMKLEMDDDIY